MNNNISPLELIAIFLLLISFFLFAGVIGAKRELAYFKYQSFERGHMVQCLGKEGYYGECK